MENSFLSSVATRVTLTLLLVALVVQSLGGYLFYKREAQSRWQAFNEKLTLNAERLQTTLSHVDDDIVPQVLKRAMNDREIYGISITKNARTIHYTRNEMGDPIATNESSLAAKELVQMRLPLSLNGEISGEFTLYETPEFLHRKLQRWIQLTIIYIFCLTVLIVISLYATMWITVLYPLKLLREYAENYDYIDAENCGEKLQGLAIEFKVICERMKAMVAHLRKQISEANDANDRFQLISRKFPMPLGIYDPITRKIEYINEQFTETFGYEAEEVPTLDVWDEKAFPDPVYREEVQRTWEKNLTQAKGVMATIDPTERRVVCKNGDIKFVQIAGIVATDEFVLGIFNDVTDRRQAEKAVVNQQNRLRELTGHIQDVREEERKRIAQELHDELGQLLTVARIDLAKLEDKIDPKNIELLDGIRSQFDLLDNASDAARRLSENLRPGMLDLVGLAAALELHVKQFSKSTGILVNLDMGDADHFDVGDRVATTAFRIVQESLTNVARYAKATQVDIYLDNLGEEIVLVVKDNGIGFDQSAKLKKTSFGLLGMRERAEMLGGSVSVETAPGAGVRIEATLPIRSSTQDD